VADTNPPNEIDDRKAPTDGDVDAPNSCPIDFPGVLFIGAYNDGRVERPSRPVNLDSLQKTFTDRLNEAWPPIFYLQKVLKTDNVEFLAVLVPGSRSRPHFAGRSFVRVGSETRDASEAQFNELLCLAPDLLDSELSVFMQRLRAQGAAGGLGRA
jgi:hypothetical protein